MRREMVLALALAAAACGPTASPAADRASPQADAGPGIDSLNTRIAQAYRAHDHAAYATLFTDGATFEWPAVTTVRGRAAMEAMARGNWAAIDSMDLVLRPEHRSVVAGGDEATEFGAFDQHYRDSAGRRHVEHGRYVHLLARGSDGQWRIERFFGFSDSSRAAPARR